MSRGRFAPRHLRRDPDGRYRLPPALAKLPSGRSRLPREFIEQNQRDRILLAALGVFGTKGFAPATVQDLIGEASVSRETFYKFFADKEACFLAVQDEVLGWLEEEACEAARGAPGWPHGVTAVSRRLVKLLIEDPRLARLCGVEWLLGGSKGRARHEKALGELATALRHGRAERSWGKDLPSGLESILVAGVVSVSARKIAYGPAPTATTLARELSEFILVPYLGARDARRTVRGPG